MSERLNVLDPEFRANPYPSYAKLRRESPVCQVEPNGMWAVSRYDDIIAVLKNPKVFSSSALAMALQPSWLKRTNPVGRSIAVMDPPEHGRLRKLVAGAFTPNLLNRMESYTRDVSSRLTEMVLQKQTVEFMSEFCVGVPASILALVMGFDLSLANKFKSWGDAVNGVTALGPNDVERQAQLQQTIGEMEKYLHDLIEQRRVKPAEDLTTELLQVRVEGESLTHEELIAFLAILLVAGLETTAFLIAHCTMILAQYPELMEGLRYNEVRLTNFIEEVLRYEPPAHGTMRLTTEETELGGVRLPAYAPVLLLLGSGLRDEKVYPDPERFDPNRGVQSNLAFGSGVHFCIGSQLARMESRVAMDTLLSMCGRFELLTDKLQWNNSLTGRSVMELPLRVHPI
jgi:cytochrome P450